MNLKSIFLIKLLGLFIAGAAFGFLMSYIFFAYTPNVSTKYGIFIDIINWTIGLPVILSAMIASADPIGLLLCGAAGKSTFGCWGASTVKIAIILYGLIFSAVYFLLKKKKLK